MTLVPKNFNPPTQLVTSTFLISKLCAKDVYLDYPVVMSNIEIIRETRGGNWPTLNLTFEDDFIDLAWHQREFEYKRSFAFKALSPNQNSFLGCIYFYPPNWRKKAPKGTDVDVSFWVTQEVFDQGLYEKLYYEIQRWIAKDWPFKHPFWTNKFLP